MYKDKNYNPVVAKKLTKSMLFKAIEKLCSGYNTKEPIIIISNGLTDEQINEIINFKTN